MGENEVQRKVAPQGRTLRAAFAVARLEKRGKLLTLSSSSSTERRTSQRVRCSLSTAILLPDGPVSAELMNISQRGMFLRSGFGSPLEQFRLATTLRVGTRLRLTLEAGSGEGAWTAEGRVAWMSDLGVGVDFSALSDGLREWIRLQLDSEGTASNSAMEAKSTVELL